MYGFGDVETFLVCAWTREWACPSFQFPAQEDMAAEDILDMPVALVFEFLAVSVSAAQSMSSRAACHNDGTQR